MGRTCATRSLVLGSLVQRTLHFASVALLATHVSVTPIKGHKLECPRGGTCLRVNDSYFYFCTVGCFPANSHSIVIIGNRYGYEHRQQETAPEARQLHAICSGAQTWGYQRDKSEQRTTPLQIVCGRVACLGQRLHFPRSLNVYGAWLVKFIMADSAISSNAY